MSDATLEFTTSKKLKSRFSRSQFLSSVGGKVVIATMIIFFIAGVAYITVKPFYDSLNLKYFNKPESYDHFCLAISFVFFPLSFLGVAYGYRQITCKTAMIVNERLRLYGNVLCYEFQISGNQHPFAKNMITINLDDVAIVYRTKPRKIEFTGECLEGAYLSDSTNPDQVRLAAATDKSLKTFEIYDYWEPSLKEIVLNHGASMTNESK